VQDLSYREPRNENGGIGKADIEETGEDVGLWNSERYVDEGQGRGGKRQY